MKSYILKVWNSNSSLENILCICIWFVTKSFPVLNPENWIKLLYFSKVEILVVETDLEGVVPLHADLPLHLPHLQTRPHWGPADKHGAAHTLVQETVHGWDLSHSVSVFSYLLQSWDVCPPPSLYWQYQYQLSVSRLKSLPDRSAPDLPAGILRVAGSEAVVGAVLQTSLAGRHSPQSPGGCYWRGQSQGQ